MAITVKNNSISRSVRKVLQVTNLIKNRKAQDAFYDAQEKHGNGAPMMRLAKDLDMDVSDDKYDRLNYY